MCVCVCDEPPELDLLTVDICVCVHVCMCMCVCVCDEISFSNKALEMNNKLDSKITKTNKQVDNTIMMVL